MAHSVDRPLTRRGFLGGLVAIGAAACSGGDDGGAAGSSSTTTSSLPVPALSDEPFTLGVASGDPTPEAVVLWTRLAPDPLDPASMPEVDVPVDWEVATDEGFDDVVRSGTFVTGPAVAHSVHVDVDGLAPGSDYHYRFRVGDHESPVGRTRTAPAGDASPDRLRFAVANCQAWQSGYYTAYRHLAAEDLDVVLFVGDYIYELESSRSARPHDLPPPRTLDEYRVFYGLNKTDADLRAAHARHPWIVTWDDHEVEDNYADDHPGAVGAALDPDAAVHFPAKRAAAYRAWWEHMPVRTGPPDADGSLRIYRALAWGDLATFAVLDDRQYRSPLATGGAGDLPRLAGGGPQLPAAFAEDRTLLGAEQEDWLADVLTSSRSRWNVLVQQTVMAQVDRAPDDPAKGFSMDAWDGYVAARNRLLGLVRDEGVADVVAVGGDIHSSVVTDLLADYSAPGGPIVATEFVAPSISALEILPAGYVQGALSAPHIHLYDVERRGYLRCEVTPDRWTADYRWVSTTAEPEATIETASTWVVDAGTPGARRA